ncbi:MAG: hypothetical protein DCC57_15395, partial [Chloroflexi bacterium]
PVTSTLRYFRHEYEAHILNRHCAAGVCDLDQMPVLALVAGHPTSDHPGGSVNGDTPAPATVRQ